MRFIVIFALFLGINSTFSLEEDRPEVSMIIQESEDILYRLARVIDALLGRTKNTKLRQKLVIDFNKFQDNTSTINQYLIDHAD